MTIEPRQTVATIAVDHPAATRVFARHGIDYCCGGGKPLREVCAASSLDLEQILAEIHHELMDIDAPATRWEDRPLDELIDHILLTYHRSLKEELPRLDAMARKVWEVHHEKAPVVACTTWRALWHGLAELETSLHEHLHLENNILFPRALDSRA